MLGPGHGRRAAATASPRSPRDHAGRAGEPVLRREDLTARHQLERRLARGAARRGRRARRPARRPGAARPPRPSRARCRSTRAASTVDGKSAAPALDAGARSGPASRCCPRTARPRASSRACRSGRTSCWPRCRASPGSAWSTSGKQDEIVDDFMKRLRIKASSPDQQVGELSGGNQQKVLLARWLRLNPKVLLLDEPTRGIDVGAKAEVQALIDELAEEGLGVAADLLRPRGAHRGLRPGRRAASDGAVVGRADRRRRQPGGADASRWPRRRRASPDGTIGMSTDAARRRPRRGPCDQGRLLAWLPGVRRLRGDRAALLVNIVLTPNFLPRSNLRMQLFQASPIADRGARHGAGDRHRGHRPVGRLGDGAGRGAHPALPRLRRRRRRSWSRSSAARRRPRSAGSLVAFVGVQPIVATLALMVGLRGLAGHLNGATAKRSHDPTLARARHRQLARRAAILVDRRVARRRVVAFVVRRTTFGRQLLAIGDNRGRELAGRPAGAARADHRLRLLRCPRRARRGAPGRSRRLRRPRARPATRAVRDHRGRGRRHAADRRPGPRRSARSPAPCSCSCSPPR